MDRLIYGQREFIKWAPFPPASTASNNFNKSGAHIVFKIYIGVDNSNKNILMDSRYNVRIAKNAFSI